MTTLLRNSLRVSVGEAFFNDIASGRSRYYYVIGKPVSWPDDDNPPDPVNSVQADNLTRGVIVNSKLITPQDAAFVINRIDWVSGQVYDMYDDQLSDLEDRPFYVVSSEFNVYKCLDNNSFAPSTVEPFGVQTDPIETTDGYRWKFIYNVGAALRNKFLTGDLVPVTNSITDSYYSKGSISSVVIQNAGTGYSETIGQLQVDGDGFQESNPYDITAIGLTGGGSGYTGALPTVTVDGPVTNFRTWAASTAYVLGQYVKSGNHYYQAQNSGISGTIAPAHITGNASNGTIQFKYTGTGVRANLTQDTSAVGGIKIVNQGSGYAINGTISFTAPGSGATGIANTDSGKITSVTMTATGTGYTGASTVLISEPFLTYTAFAASTAVNLGQILRVVGATTYYYRVITAGTTGATAPVHTSGIQGNGTCALEFAGERATGTIIRGTVTAATLIGFVRSFKVIAGGTGYTTATISVSNGAQGNVIIEAGKIKSVILTSRGSDVIGAAPTVTITGNGTGAQIDAVVAFSFGYPKQPNATITAPADVNGMSATARLEIVKTDAVLVPIVQAGTGQIVGVQIVDGGIGYTRARIIAVGGNQNADLESIIGTSETSSVQATNELLAVPFSISAIKVQSRGRNYGTAKLTIVGDGAGATAEAVIVNGEIVRVRVTNQGSGYTYAYVNIESNLGVEPASLRVIVSPPKGHGSNPIRELFSKSISIYSTLSAELNQGLLVTNDYRQLGILRNPLRYRQNALMSDGIASACYKIEAVIPPMLVLTADDLLQRQTDGSMFRLIQMEGTTLLLQELDNAELQINDQLVATYNGSSYTLNVTDVIPPDLDKFSGDLLFVNNLSPYNVTDEQAVAIRTFITI